MAESRQMADWQRTAWLSALIANVNRDPKKRPRPFAPDDFNPLARRDRTAGAVPVTAENIGDLKAAFASMQKG